MEKKSEERNILSKFINRVSLEAKILSVENAQQVYPTYNGENPDFIIQIANFVIGVELFELNLNRSPQLAGHAALSGRQAVNLPHLEAGRRNFYNSLEALEADIRKGNRRLKPQDLIQEVIDERLKEKMTKVREYVTSDIWLIGYANHISFQVGLVQNIIRDNAVELLKKRAEELSKDVSNFKRFYLFETETSSKDVIIELYNRC